MFHNTLCKFWKSLKQVLPESAPVIKQAAEYYKSHERIDYLRETKQLLDPHMKYISQNDPGIFSDDYSASERFLLPSMDFRLIWNMTEQTEDFIKDKELRESTQHSIFKHLQHLYLRLNLALDQIGVFDMNLEKQKQFLLNMLENLKIDEEVKQKIDEMKAAEAEEETESKFNLGDLGQLLGDDNLLVKIAEDITKDLDLGIDDIDNPVEAIMSLFEGNRLQDLIVSVGDKITEKIESGEVDQAKIISDAQKMSKVIGNFAPQCEEMFQNN